MFWTVGLEIDVPQTNPTTRDRLPFRVKCGMLAVVHRRRQHGVREDALLSGMLYCPVHILCTTTEVSPQSVQSGCCFGAESIPQGQVPVCPARLTPVLRIRNDSCDLLFCLWIEI